MPIITEVSLVQASLLLLFLDPVEMNNITAEICWTDLTAEISFVVGDEQPDLLYTLQSIIVTTIRSRYFKKGSWHHSRKIGEETSYENLRTMKLHIRNDLIERYYTFKITAVTTTNHTVTKESDKICLGEFE